MRPVSFIKEVRTELKKVNWLTLPQAVRFTIAVVIGTLLVAAFLGAVDYIMSQVLELIV